MEILENDEKDRGNLFLLRIPTSMKVLYRRPFSTSFMYHIVRRHADVIGDYNVREDYDKHQKEAREIAET